MTKKGKNLPKEPKKIPVHSSKNGNFLRLESGKIVPFRYKSDTYYKDFTFDVKTFGQRFRDIRSNIYGLTMNELAELIGVDYKTIQHIELGHIKRLSLDVLLRCAKLYSSIPNKDGVFCDISVDYLLGFINYTSITNELIANETGLSDEAINKLKGHATADSIVAGVAMDAIEKSKHVYNSLAAYLKLPIINALLESDHLPKFLRALYAYSYDTFINPVLKVDNDYVPIPAKDIYLSTDSDSGDCIPLGFDKDFREAVNKNIMDKTIEEFAIDLKLYYLKGIGISKEDVLKMTNQKGP